MKRLICLMFLACTPACKKQVKDIDAHSEIRIMQHKGYCFAVLSIDGEIKAMTSVSCAPSP